MEMGSTHAGGTLFPSSLYLNTYIVITQYVFFMRIWHKHLIPQLCTKHFVAVWREALGAYNIITEDKQGYRNHPATKEFEDSPGDLWDVLALIKQESIKRGYNFKELPPKVNVYGQIKEWQSLQTQITILRNKGCNCNL